VLVNENAHYMDEEARWTAGEFDTAEEALAKCRHVVDLSLHVGLTTASTPDGLLAYYRAYGDDPFIAVVNSHGPISPPPFSAWDYAEARCRELCAAGSGRAP
jgi:hypothetical protein